MKLNNHDARLYSAVVIYGIHWVVFKKDEWSYYSKDIKKRGNWLWIIRHRNGI